ncbi:hypothetical protein GCM10012275_48420 [Longimycelium tulufanense]|uniref:Uncharacterized protein n=2 Tax=Longimycelium tulufanense TaxID=907463 RepID=A0A8J3FWI4_9PSEU|nr:hypothetical protein GCM10012275_48420 [Longimycelium tulufanense]
MSEQPHSGPGSPRPRRDSHLTARGFDMTAYLSRQLEEMTDTLPTEEILRRADERRAGGVDRELIAESIRQMRKERAEW